LEAERKVPQSAAIENDWVTAMRAADFARAWTINDRDLPTLCRAAGEKHSGPRHLQRIWRGEDLAGKRVLVRCYHGLGDTIQFVRFMPALRAIACEVTLWCQPALLGLLERAPGIDRLLPLHDGVPEVEFDIDIEIMEVPHAIHATRNLVEVGRSYLTLPRAWDSLPRVSAGLTVGLVWDVGDWSKRRCVPPRLLRNLNGSGIKLCSLQRGPAASGTTDIGAKDVSTADICTLGYKISQMDVVVCVDTMVAHLAGALGFEAWVLLEANCDWRWPISGNTTPWYPTLRLFHQPSPGDWAGAIGNVRHEVMARARQEQGECLSSP
jgi:hypothetical protein